MDKDSVDFKAYFRCAADVLPWISTGFDNLISNFGFGECGQGDAHSKEQTAPIGCAADLLHYVERFGDCNVYGDNCEGNMFRFENDVPSHVSFGTQAGDPRIVLHRRQLFDDLDAGGAWYAYACCWSEYVARHGVLIPVTFPHGGTTSWELRFGEDCREYLPGLYWLTYVSRDYCQQLNVDADELARKTNASVVKLRNGMLLELYEHPEDWQSRNEAIQEVIDATPCVFSIRDIGAIPHGLPPAKAREWMENMKKDWR